MDNLNYSDVIIKQSQKNFSLMKEKMLEPVKQVQQIRKESLKNFVTKIEKKQHILQEKRISLEKLCRE